MKRKRTVSRENNARTLIWALLFFVTMLVPFVTRGQNIDSLILVINHSQVVAAINDAKSRMPEYLSKVDMTILDVIAQLRAAGIKPTDVGQPGLHGRFSTLLST